MKTPSSIEELRAELVETEKRVEGLRGLLHAQIIAEHPVQVGDILRVTTPNVKYLFGPDLSALATEEIGDNVETYRVGAIQFNGYDRPVEFLHRKLPGKGPVKFQGAAKFAIHPTLVGFPVGCKNIFILYRESGAEPERRTLEPTWRDEPHD